MKFLFLLLFVFCTPFFVSAQQTNPFPETLYYRVSVNVEQPDVIQQMGMLGLAIDHVHIHDRHMHAELSGYELNLMIEAGIRFEVVQDDMASFYEAKLMADPVFQSRQLQGENLPVNFKLGSMGGHLTLDEVIAELDEMHQLFPDLITPKFSIGESYEGRDIWTVWIGTDLDETKPQAYYNSLIHAREPMSMMNLVYYMWWLLENYGEDELATFLIDQRHMAFTLVLNPDGYEFNRINNPNGGGMQRKNRRPVGTFRPGVDLNRNFGPYIFWDHPNNPGGSSTDPNNDTYRGSEPFSEPETQALKEFVLENDFRAVFNYHNYSDLLIYPYGALQRRTIEGYIFEAYAQEMTRFNGYEHGTDVETVGYATRGGADDWFYGFESGNDNRVNAISMTPEVGNASDGIGGWGGAFWARAERIIPLSEDNLLPNQLLAVYAGPALRQTELDSIGAYQPVADFSPAISSSDAEIGQETFFSLSFDEEIFNAGRTDMEVVFTATTDADYVAFVEDTVTLNIGIDEFYIGSTPDFLMELDAFTQPDENFTVTVEMTIPFTEEFFSWDFSFTTFGTPVSLEPGTDLPKMVELHQNYPNPFNPTTVLTYSLPESGSVLLQVYNMQGQLVQTLVNEHNNAGRHEVSFDAGSLASGLYIYRLQTGNEIQSRKMMLVK
ncbi:MAG: T9SS type A sorting domain-containing protein [Balneolales bacterium]|nr:T9SS type A sorting domain-containing protein [Balneolales bacterium]